ncbi:MAG TPA: hypothetical protein PLE19_20095 [Planctomycetota bacterium]|nr:hypothetical protein [Planctomycetota bacterium]HRR82346.1 hypothetical protein [Planctomycetota bacterium]HRT94618.1 hypothetical protein [Planctomycetota bacterium]
MATHAPARARRLGDVLVEHGLITREQRRAALREQRVSRRRLGQVLLEQEALTRDQLNWALGHLLGIPYVEPDAQALEPDLVAAVSLDLLRRHEAVPMVRIGDELTVAMADPTDARAIEEIQAATGARVRVAVADAAAIRRVLDAVAARAAPGPPRFEPTRRGALPPPVGAVLADPWELRALGFAKDDAARLRRAAHARDGLLVVCGPRRSGCSMTLHALLRAAGPRRRQAVTLEATARLRCAEATQLEARTRDDYLAALGRLAPDPPPILLAERLHEREFWAAFRPEALVSTLLLGEMRAPDPLTALALLRENGVPGPLLANSLRLIVAQRLERALKYEILEPSRELRDLLLDGAPASCLRRAIGRRMPCE